MKRLVDLFNKVIKKHKKLKKWQRIVTILAAMITFVTTYALILPAITVEKDETDRVSGMYLEEAAELVEEVEDEAPLENALVPLSFVIAADQENAVTYSYEDDNIFAELVISTDEELPEGTELVLNYVDPESDAYADLSSRAKELLNRGWRKVRRKQKTGRRRSQSCRQLHLHISKERGDIEKRRRNPTKQPS